MRLFLISVLCLFLSARSYAQQTVTSPATTHATGNKDNIYDIKNQFLYNVLHNPSDKDNDEDNDLARFNRWFHDAEVRCYPSGNLPNPGILISEHLAQRSAAKQSRKQSGGSVWQPLGPNTVPSNFNGIGRVNCIVIDPLDTNTLYVGSACGGVHISHDGGTTWTSNTDNFPSLSIADIAVNPRHTDTIFAATGDGYGYENGSANIFWGGLYSAGVMRSIDGGKTWDTTGLSFLQSNKDIIQRLLINPYNPNVLLAATRSGILRTRDAGASWNTVLTGHIYSIAFAANSAGTVYAINANDLLVSYDTGSSWRVLYPGINPKSDRCSIAVSPASPTCVWVLNSNDDLLLSHNNGVSFVTTISPSSVASFYGYYDRVLAVSPTDSDYIYAFGMIMAISRDDGHSWTELNPSHTVHVDNHAFAINPLHTKTIYTGNDGGICVSRDGGAYWTNLGNGLMISQIYRMSSSQQHPYMLLCGLQDNGSFSANDSTWLEISGGDGEACAINPQYDQLQISSSQNGYFNMSFDAGVSFTHLAVSSETGAWTSPVVFDPNNENNIYFGLQNIYATQDGAASFINLTKIKQFANGATALAIGQSNSSVLYAADYSHITRTLDGGVTWKDVTGNLGAAGVAITYIAVDYNNPLLVYVTTSGYISGAKVFCSISGGTYWTNISANLPNIPADCIAVDSSTPGALFVGTDLGVYYTDSSQTGWSLYNTGLPNVIANDLNINYGNYKVRVATYGRGVWECNLVKPAPPLPPASVTQINTQKNNPVFVYPNPAITNWRLVFSKLKPNSYKVIVTDMAGRTVRKQENSALIDASGLASGVYNIQVFADNEQYNIKAVRK